MVLIVYNLDFENEDHTKFEYHGSINFRSENFKINLNLFSKFSIRERNKNITVSSEFTD